MISHLNKRYTVHFRKPGLPQSGAARKPGRNRIVWLRNTEKSLGNRGTFLNNTSLGEQPGARF